MNEVRFSIITVVYNDVSNIEKTILSVINQTSANYEYIVVDGGSNDGTLEIIMSFEDKIDLIISEPDKGLYDAMNKGFNLAQGKWVYYLNSNDMLENDRALQNVEALLDETMDVVHLNCRVVENNGNEINVRSYPKSIEEIAKWPCVQHQSVMTKHSVLAEQNGFSLEYKILSDYDFFLKLFVQKKKFSFHQNFYISIFNFGGISADKNNIKTVQRELRQIQRANLGSFSIIMQLQLTFKRVLVLFPFSPFIMQMLRGILLAKR